MATDAEAILDRLRASGGRITSARRALVNALFEHGGHPTAENLAAVVQARHPDVAQSTIYRILDDLEQLGEVQHTHLGHGPAVYHLAETAHPHLVCEDCGLVQELVKAAQRNHQQILTAPVDGIVQQLAIHTVGGIVTPAQQLMILVPTGAGLEIEAMVANKDIGFVLSGQRKGSATLLATYPCRIEVR